MACILLVDGNDVARRAMQGILARGGHRLAVVGTVPEAWDFVKKHVQVDLVFLELKLEGGNGLGLIQRMKADSFLKLLPIVVYTQFPDKDAVKRALALQVQNVLIKPYHDDAIYAEIAKAETNPWRHRHFEEEKSFCRQMGYKPEELHQMIGRLRDQLGAERDALARSAAAHALGAVKEHTAALAAQAETAGVWGVVDFLNDLKRLAEQEDWNGFTERLEGVNVADWLLAGHLDPTFMPEPFRTAQEKESSVDDQARARWFNAPKEQRCPVTDLATLQAQVEALPGCPVLDSSAAAFGMSANGHPSSLNPLMDLVARDTGLAAQMLISASQLHRQEEFDSAPLEDPRLAVGRLGEVRLAAMTRNLVLAEERYMNMPPHFSWPDYWLFQMGVARIARFTVNYLELYSLELQARMGGLLHDLGKLLLLRLHPFALQATITHAREHGVPLPEAERLFLGCTTQELALHFAEKQKLAEPYVDVIRWVDRPEEATRHRELVAAVSLARNLCWHFRVGANGDPLLESSPPLEESAEWRVLREAVFPSFDLRKFEQKVQADCRNLKLELQGRSKSTAVA